LTPHSPSARDADLALAAEIAANAGRIAMAHFGKSPARWPSVCRRYGGE
jgi:myo-inositol-1(or 4)-monophosphatase